MLAVWVRKEFLDELNARINAIGYSDRSQFIRDAIFDYLSRHGHNLPPLLKTAPSRKGKGGTPSHKAAREKGSNLSNPLNAERKRKRQIGGDEREVAQKVPD